MDTTHLKALALNFLRKLSQSWDIAYACDPIPSIICGHIHHRTCIEKHIMRTEAKCPVCPVLIETIREEAERSRSALASSSSHRTRMLYYYQMIEVSRRSYFSNIRFYHTTYHRRTNDTTKQLPQSTMLKLECKGKY
ncbi:4347_t:CDS:2 [Ambispora gerdemannii]|uniref:4347_t:CDS:1 n=1 Tax=Ambispora gerdemannii TaxID=144530 RepID=A0A9N9GCL9_9GLOM|nr:4347_t:CDS:2 [Ambispora gerdemannii]